jgi:predicted  nucleic acid-binding Zn-ribbon protein
MFVTKDEVLQKTLLEVQAIDAKLERLEFELNVQVGRVLELNNILEAKNKEIETLRANDHKAQDIPVQQE